eukprot:scaffold29383_cov102-Isochrysis_galbana.AAC.3
MGATALHQARTSCRTALGANGADSRAAKTDSGGSGSASNNPSGGVGPASVDEKSSRHLPSRRIRSRGQAGRSELSSSSAHARSMRRLSDGLQRYEVGRTHCEMSDVRSVLL